MTRRECSPTLTSARPHLATLCPHLASPSPGLAGLIHTHIQVGVSYKKLPRDYLPPLCSGRAPYYDGVLNDEWVSVSSGREDFGQMKRTQYEVAMFLCEDDRCAPLNPKP